MKSLFSSVLALASVGLTFAACSSDEGGGSFSAGGASGASGSGNGSGGTLVIPEGGSGGCDPYTGLGCGSGGEGSYVPACSNSIVDTPIGEVCDDGNAESGDGCTANCDQVEENYACPTPGEACVSTVACGDDKISGDETCDDGNGDDGDGCDSSCTLEVGWACPIPGIRCQAAECGDGIIAGKEQCDFETPVAGCDATTCQVDPAYACDSEGCHVTSCGDGVAEGSEACDDENNDWGDACTPSCQKEPDCSAGACTSTCGDGIVLPGDTSEECDDGNTSSGDGCSPECEVEEGYTCEPAEPEMRLPMVLRDFIGWCPGPAYDPDASNAECDENLSVAPVGHPDFEISPSGNQTDGTVETALDADGKPVNAHGDGPLTPADANGWTTGQDFFQWWYRDNPTYNKTFVSTIELIETSAGSGVWEYERNPFWPLDVDPPGSDPALESLVALNLEQPRDAGHNFYFTSEVRYWFQYNSDTNAANDPVLTFYGDDDVWVFIKNTLTADIGGIHGQNEESVTIIDSGDAVVDQYGEVANETIQLDLEDGKVYEIVVFQAERHVTGSNYQLTLEGFGAGKSKCESVCGDGVVTPDEVCDDGVNEGGYNGCEPGCQARGPYCGDELVQKDEGETCDDGLNLSQYGGCAPGCVAGPYCGDGKVQSKYEACDDGDNDGGYNECAEACQLGERCGDGQQQQPEEECDDGDRDAGDGCDAACNSEVVK